MSKGSPRKTMRFPDRMIVRIEAAITSANAHRAGVPYDWTGWVLQAVLEKLRSLERGRKSAAKLRGVRRFAGEVSDTCDRQTEGAAHAPMSSL